MTVIGAGAVGLNLGGRLALAGHAVTFIVRQEDVARGLEASGVEVEDLLEKRTRRALVRARSWQRVGSALASPMLICTRLKALDELAPQLSALAPGAAVVGAQNDIPGDEVLARHFETVWGVVVRQTSTKIGDHRIRIAGAGRLVLGSHSGSRQAEMNNLAQALRDAGFDLSVACDLAAERWLKLCVNLMSTPNALVRREDHRTPAFVEVKARLLEEARDALAAAGIAADSGDGRDRSLDEEIRHQRESLSGGTSARDLPLYNQVWAALRQPGSEIEADGYHRRILALAGEHRVAAPVNQRVLGALLEAVHGERGPECVSAAELLP